MAKKIPGGKVVFGVDDKEFDKGIRGMERKAKRLSAKLTSISNQFKAASVAGVAAIGLSIKKFAAFETGLAQIATLGVKDMTKVKNSLQDLRRQYGITGQEATKGYYDIISAGAKTHEEAIATQQAAIKLAKAGNAELGLAVDVVTTSLNSYASQGETASSITDKLFEAVKGGKTTVIELGQTLGRIAPQAAQMGISFSELTATYAVLTAKTGDTTIATTQLSQFLNSITKVTPEAAAEAKRLGLDFSSAALETKGLNKFLADMEEATGGDTVAMGKLLGSANAVKFGMSILSKDGIAKLNKALKDAENSAGSTDEAFKQVSKTIGHKFKKTMQDVNVFVEILGETFFTALAPAFKMVSVWLSKITKDKGTQTLTSNIVLLVTAVSLLALGFFRLGGATVLAFGAKGFVVAAKQARVLIGAIHAMKFSVKALMAATGFGLIILGVVLLIENWDKLISVFSRYSLGDIIKLMWIKAKIYLNEILIAFEKAAMAVQDNALFRAFGVGVDDNINKIKQLRDEIDLLNNQKPKPNDLEKPEPPAALVADEETASGLPSPPTAKIEEFKQKLQAQKDGNLALLENELWYLEEKARLKAEALELANALDGDEAQLKLDINNEKQEALDEQHLEFQERRNAADLEYKAILDELNLEYDADEFERIYENMETVDDMKKANREKEILELAKHRSAIQLGTSKDEKAKKKTQGYVNSEEEKNRIVFLNSMAGIAKKGSALMKAIRIAEALQALQIAISTTAPEAYIKTSAFYAWPVGPVLGAMHYASIVGTAAKGMADVRSMNEGGIMGGVAGIDNNMAEIGQGELVVPTANFDEVIDAVATARVPATQEISLSVDGEILANIVLDKLEQNRAI